MRTTTAGINERETPNNIIIIEGDWLYSECLKALFVSDGAGIFQYYHIADFLNNGTHLVKDADVVLLDAGLDHDDGLDLIPTIKLYNPNISVVVLTRITDCESIRKAFQLGACGYLLKDEPMQDIYEQVMGCCKKNRVAISYEALSSFIKEDDAKYTAHGFNQLFTDRESEVIAFLEKGLTQKEIGTNMNISSATVNQHLKHIYQKMHVRSKTELLYKMR